MGYNMSFLSGPSCRDGVGGVDPAVGVHDAAGHAVDDAVDRVADVLTRRHEKWRKDKDDQRRFVVKAEHIAVESIFLRKILIFFIVIHFSLNLGKLQYHMFN